MTSNHDIDAKRSGISDNKDMKMTATHPDQSTSAAPPAYDTKNDSPFAIISFHTSDRIRFLQLPESEIDRLQECIRCNWDAGVSDCKLYNVSKELKLKGYPWNGSHSGNPKVMKLVQAILAEMFEMGWKIEQGVVMCKKADPKDSILFRRTTQPAGSASWISISFDQHHVLTVHGGSSEFRQCLIARFSSQGWSAESAYVEDRMEIRLKKSYWMCQGEETVQARLMLLEVAQALDLFGFRIYTSLRLGSYNDALFCIKEEQNVLL